jgi:hypothetical protein
MPPFKTVTRSTYTPGIFMSREMQIVSCFTPDASGWSKRQSNSIIKLKTLINSSLVYVQYLGRIGHPRTFCMKSGLFTDENLSSRKNTR